MAREDFAKLLTCRQCFNLPVARFLIRLTLLALLFGCLQVERFLGTYPLRRPDTLIRFIPFQPFFNVECYDVLYSHVGLQVLDTQEALK